MAPKQSAAKRRVHLVPLSPVVRASQDVPYGRVSSDIQHDSQTIETQKRILRKDITSRDDPNLPVGEQRKLVDEFWDDPCSGTIPFEDRPEGKRLVRSICARGDIDCDGSCGGTGIVIDTVWVTKLDRLARRLLILIEIEKFLRLHRVGLKCLEHNIDTSSPTGALIFTILGAIAQWEHGVILERTANGKRTKTVEGRHMGRKSLGLKTDEQGYLVIDDALVGQTGKMAYQIVQEVFANIIDGSSIEREAERFGITPRRIHLMLHNPRYRGEGGMYWDGNWIAAERNKPPQLVSPEDWELAQEKLADHKRFAARNRKREYIVSSLMICHEPKDNGTPCGRVFVARTAKGKYAYYCCYRKGCTAHPIRGNDVETAVWTAVRERLVNPDAWLQRALEQGGQTDKVRELRSELSVVIDKLSKLSTQRLSVARQTDEGVYTEEESRARQAEIREQVESLTDRKTTLEIQLRLVNKSQATLRRSGLQSVDIGPELDRIEAWCESSDPEEVHRGRTQKTALIRSRIERIEVRNGSGGQRLTIFWNEDEHADELSLTPRGSAQALCNEQPILIVTELDLPAPCGQGRRTDLETLSSEEASGILA
jgi:site-specific DNA recombinase